MKIKQLQTWGELSKQGGQVGALGGGGWRGEGSCSHRTCTAAGVTWADWTLSSIVDKQHQEWGMGNGEVKDKTLLANSKHM